MTASTVPIAPALNYARRLNASVIELIPPEVIDIAAIYVMETDVASLTVTAPASSWLLDATNVSGITGFEELLAATKRASKQYGLKKLVLVVPTPLGQMTVDGYLSRAPVTTVWFETRLEALRFLKVLR